VRRGVRNRTCQCGRCGERQQQRQSSSAASCVYDSHPLPHFSPTHSSSSDQRAKRRRSIPARNNSPVPNTASASGSGM
jgi:hypothetical protein